MSLILLRGAFVVLVAAVICLYVIREGGFQDTALISFAQAAGIVVGTVAMAAAVIGLDSAYRHKKLSVVSGMFLGLLAGLLSAYALSFVVDLIGIYTAPPDGPRRVAFFELLEGVKVVIGLITCYIAISLVLQTKDDFRFVIPYVEFSKRVRGPRQLLLDTSVLIDGRLLELIDCGLVQGEVVTPQFVIDELHTLSDSSTKLKRERGRRGLDVLAKLLEQSTVEARVDDTFAEPGPVDHQLLDAAERLQARLVTTDANLAKLAEVRGVEAMNLHDAAEALRPVALPGDRLRIRIVRPGEGPRQGVGYLPDGTMVVVEEGRDHIDQQIEVTVTSAIRTSAGRMVFGKYEAADITKEPGPKPDADPPTTRSAESSGPQPRRTNRSPGRRAG